MMSAGQLEQRVQNMRQAVKDHGDALITQSQNLLELGRSQSEDHTKMEATIIMQSRIAQQNQIGESAKIVIHLEDMGVALQASLDSILDSLKKHKVAQSIHDLKAEAQLKQVQEALLQLQQSVKPSLDSLTKVVTALETTQKAERKPRSSLEAGCEDWLHQLATQLAASGIASVMTGAVVMLAARPGFNPAQTFSRK